MSVTTATQQNLKSLRYAKSKYTTDRLLFTSSYCVLLSNTTYEQCNQRISASQWHILDKQMIITTIIGASVKQMGTQSRPVLIRTVGTLLLLLSSTLVTSAVFGTIWVVPLRSAWQLTVACGARHALSASVPRVRVFGLSICEKVNNAVSWNCLWTVSKSDCVLI